MKKKLAATILGALMFSPVILPPNNFLPASIVCAEIQTIEADGYYIMGDGLEENQGVAKERAREDAKRAASEQACTFVESISEVKNNNLTRDEIYTISASILNVINDSVNPEISGNSIMFHCHITVTVDTSNVIDTIQKELYKHKQKFDDLTRQIKEKDAEIARLNAEIEKYKKDFVAASVTEKNEIKAEVKVNEKQFTAMQWNDKGLMYYNAGDYQKAVECLNKAIKLNPELAVAWSNLGSIYNRLKDYEKAFEYLNKAIEINPNYHKAWNNLGSTYSKLEQYEKAVECFGNAIKFNPNDATAYYNLATAYYKLDNNEKAVELYTKTIELNPKDARTWFMLGYIYYNLGDTDKALNCLDKVIELRPDEERYIKLREDVLARIN